GSTAAPRSRRLRSRPGPRQNSFRARALAVRLRLGLAHARRLVVELALGLERRTVAEGLLAGEGLAAAGLLAGQVGRLAVARDAQLLTGAPHRLQVREHV